MKDEIRPVLARAKTGTLSVIDFETGGPFGALVNVATDSSGMPLFLFSTLARHTKCLAADPRASLLISELPGEGDPLVGFRATIAGRADKTPGHHMREHYLAKHPYAETYIDFGDFSFWTLKPEKIFVVGGFGRIQAFDASEIFGAKTV
jgi:heme iron utilization protein